jgi:hypothetical protein
MIAHNPRYPYATTREGSVEDERLSCGGDNV